MMSGVDGSGFGCTAEEIAQQLLPTIPGHSKATCRTVFKYKSPGWDAKRCLIDDVVKERIGCVRFDRFPLF